MISSTIVSIANDCYVHHFVVEFVDNAKITDILSEVHAVPIEMESDDRGS
jgi:hypothetical protein